MKSNVIHASFLGQNQRASRRIRRPNIESRTREYLEQKEIEKLIAAANNNRHSLRDQLIITMGYRHGLRCCEIAH